MPHQCIECSRTFADGSKQMLAGCPDCGGNKFQFRPKGSVALEDTQSESESLTPTQSTTQSKSSKASTSEKTRTTTLREWAKKKVTPGSSTTDTSPTETAVATNAGSRSAQASKPAGSRSQSASTEAQRSTATELDSFGDESVQDEARRENISPSDAETVPDLDHEDSAQADARSGLVGPDELPDPPASDDATRQRADLQEADNFRQGDDDRQSNSARQPDGSSKQGDSNLPDGADQSDGQEPRPDLAQLREELNDQFESIKVVNPGQYELNLMELYDREEYIIALQENGRYVIEVPDAWDATE